MNSSSTSSSFQFLTPKREKLWGKSIQIANSLIAEHIALHGDLIVHEQPYSTMATFTTRHFLFAALRLTFEADTQMKFRKAGNSWGIEIDEQSLIYLHKMYPEKMRAMRIPDFAGGGGTSRAELVQGLLFVDYQEDESETEEDGLDESEIPLSQLNPVGGGYLLREDYAITAFHFLVQDGNEVLDRHKLNLSETVQLPIEAKASAPKVKFNLKQSVGKETKTGGGHG